MPLFPVSCMGATFECSFRVSFSNSVSPSPTPNCLTHGAVLLPLFRCEMSESRHPSIVFSPIFFRLEDVLKSTASPNSNIISVPATGKLFRNQLNFFGGHFCLVVKLEEYFFPKMFNPVFSNRALEMLSRPHVAIVQILCLMLTDVDLTIDSVGDLVNSVVHEKCPVLVALPVFIPLVYSIGERRNRTPNLSV